MNGEAKFALKGRFAVNGDNNKARLITVFDIMRDGEAVTVVLLRYSIENDLVMRPIVEVFEEFSVFWGEDDADNFITGHGNREAHCTTLAGFETELEAGTDSTAYLQTVGNRIKAARVKAGLSKRELAKLVAVTNQTIKKWEKGQQMPLREDVSAIAQACGTSPQWLLAGSKLRDDGHGS